MMMNSDSRNTSRLLTGGLRYSRLRSIHSRKLKAFSAFIQFLRARQYTGCAVACVPGPSGPCLGSPRRTPLMTFRQCIARAAALWLTLLAGMPLALAQEASAPPDTTAAPVAPAGPQTVQA